MIGGANPVIGGGLVLFSMLLAAIVSSDIISRDLSDNSFVAGKMLGVFGIMAVFCLLPVIIYGVAIIATQSESEYLESFEVLGRATVAGILTSIFFMGLGTMFSSVTKSRTYAGVGTFVSFFVLTLISGMFSTIDVNWRLVNPLDLLQFSYGMIFGNGLPEELSPGLYWAIILSILVIPLLFAYWRVHRKAVGK
jgi:ABC-type transport system involved in multi-copper enzyme maturation permease subunit